MRIKSSRLIASCLKENSDLITVEVEGLKRKGKDCKASSFCGFKGIG